MHHQIQSTNIHGLKKILFLFSTMTSQFQVFGIFEAYCNILESSHLFGKCPFTWDKKRGELYLDTLFFGYSFYWVKVIFSMITYFIPGWVVVIRYFCNQTGVTNWEDNIPLNVIGVNVAMLTVVTCLVLVFAPLVIFWNKYGILVQRQTFEVFETLIAGNAWYSLLYRNPVLK